MHIVVTGGTGFIGQALIPALLAQGHRVTVTTRYPSRVYASHQSLRYVGTWADIALPVNAVINLAGASLAAHRWTKRYKTEIRSSRIDATARLVAWLKTLDQPPEVLLSGSAIGFYGCSDTATFTESSSPGSGFAAALCQDWEQAAGVAQSLSVRVVLLRLGVVLDREGGAFLELSKTAGFGLQSWLGSGSQYLSWIHRSDVVSAILVLLRDASVTGPVNLVAPHPISHRDFARALSDYKPTWLRAAVPAPIARALLGEMADELLLNGQRVVPGRLHDLGFTFDYPNLESAIADITGFRQ